MAKNKFESLCKGLKKVGQILLSIILGIIGHIVLIYAGIYIGVSQCEASVIYYGQEVESIIIASKNETIFRFDEPVKTITRASKLSITPADSANPDYSVLSVSPLFSQGNRKVTFLLANGAVVTTKIIISSKKSPELVDSFYDFVPKSELVEKKANSAPDISELELMKAMLRGDEVVGMKQRPLARFLSTGLKGVTAKLVRIYTGSKFNGYVFLLKNRFKRTSYDINLRQLTLGYPNQAILSQVDKQKLGPRQLTFLRVVSKPSSRYYSINLPVSVIKRSRKQK